VIYLGKACEAAIRDLTAPIVALIKAEIENALWELYDAPLALKFGGRQRGCRETIDVFLWKEKTR
jgi:hypothetical protein